MMANSKYLLTFGAPIVTIVLYILKVGYGRRSRIDALRKQGVAMPAGWSWWFGHLLVLDKKLKPLPPDVNVYMAMDDLVRDHADTEVFLMDYWPIYDPVLMIFGPEMAQQASIKYDLPKPQHQEDGFRPIIGGSSLITMNGEEWKLWRSLLNPGFSASHMLSLVPSVVDAVDVFCQVLRERVHTGVFLMDDMAMDLAMDVITRTTLDTNLNNQREHHRFPHAMRTIIHWHSFWDPRILLNPLRIPVQFYYSRVMSSFIRGEVQSRFEEMKRHKSNDTSPATGEKAKSVIALALQEYISRKLQDGKTKIQDLHLDDGFARLASNQMRLFIFAGNDSTAAAITFTYHALHLNPSVLDQLRNEHDTIFGNDPSAAADMLRSQPALLNQCRYTMAVIKETLRLWPPASSMRDGIPGVSLVDRKGTAIPTAHLNATIMHNYIHTNPRVWPRANEFLPERWMVGSEHELYPPPGAYRPFEHGARNCIGQTLVYNELRVVLVMTARSFVVEPAYGEWDAGLRGREGVVGGVLRRLGLRGETCKVVGGERAYQTSKSGARPANGYPCRVSLVD